MRPPARLLEDAETLAFAAVPTTARFTGRLNLYRDDKRVGAVPYLAICRPHNEPGLMLLHLDAEWGLVGVQAWNGPEVERIMTVEAMKHQAERYYEGLMESWQEIADDDA